jgi:hypothetical protein
LLPIASHWSDVALKRRLPFFILLALFLVLVLVFVILFRQSVRDFLTIPVVYLYWRLKNLWLSLDPDLIWGTFILLAFIFVLITFPSFHWMIDRIVVKRKIGGWRSSIWKPTDGLEKSGERLGFWYWEVRQLSLDPYLARFSVLEVKKLLLEVVAFRQRLDSRYAAEKWIKTTEEEIPEFIRQLFDARSGRMNTTETEPADGLINRILSWLRPQPAVVPTAANDPHLEDIIHYIETQLAGGDHGE